MKKIISLIMTAVLSVTFAACGIKNNDTNTKQKINTNNQINDFSVDVVSPVKAKDEASIMQNSGELSMVSPIKTEEEKFEKAEIIIRGKVKASKYVLSRPAGLVSTKATVEVLQSYKGDLKVGEVITTRELGGFIPNDVYAKAIHKEKFGEDLKGEISKEILDKRFYGAKVMEKDEEVILYLSKIPKDAKLEEEYGDNCYGLVRAWQGKLLYNEEYDAYIPFVPEEELAPKSECENISAKYAPARYGTLKNGIQPRIFTLEEFNAFAEEMNAQNR